MLSVFFAFYSTFTSPLIYFSLLLSEQAMLDLNNHSLNGHILRLGWGKAVTLPAQPLFDAKRVKGEEREVEEW